MQAIIYELIRKYAGLTGNENVLDLYCGIGAISLFLASTAKSVHGIEVVDAAVVDAVLNARINRVGNCRFEAGDVVEQLQCDRRWQGKNRSDCAESAPERVRRKSSSAGSLVKGAANNLCFLFTGITRP